MQWSATHTQKPNLIAKHIKVEIIAGCVECDMVSDAEEWPEGIIQPKQRPCSSMRERDGSGYKHTGSPLSPFFPSMPFREDKITGYLQTLQFRLHYCIKINWTARGFLCPIVMWLPQKRRRKLNSLIPFHWIRFKALTRGPGCPGSPFSPGFPGRPGNPNGPWAV